MAKEIKGLPVFMVSNEVYNDLKDLGYTTIELDDLIDLFEEDELLEGYATHPEFTRLDSPESDVIESINKLKEMFWK